MPTLSLRSAPIAVSQLKGKPVPQDLRKVTSTASHTIQLSSVVDGKLVPDFKVALRKVVDKNAKSKIIDDSKASSIKTFDKFKTKLESWISSEKSYFCPPADKLVATLDQADRSNFAYLNIVGRRTEQFFDEALAIIEKTKLSDQDKTKARQQVNLAHREAYQNREIRFDNSDTGSYWGYTADHAFVHVFEKILLSLPENDPKRAFFQKQIDHILTHFYTLDGRVDECNIERSLSLLAIDQVTRRRVSMTNASDQRSDVKYEILTLPASSSLPEKAVYRDGKDYFIEDSLVKLNSEQVASLKRQEVSSVVLRRPKFGEALRSDFKFAWRGNGFVSKEDVSTGWYGFCDIKAIMQTLLADMGKSGGITEFRSDSGKIVEFDRNMQLEALAALINLGANYRGVDSMESSQGTYDQGGLRFYGQPDSLVIRAGQTDLTLPVRVQSMSKRGGSGVTDLDTLFSAQTPDRKLESFKPNPRIVRVEGGGATNFVNVNDRKLTAVLEKQGYWGYTFNESGQIIHRAEPFSINPCSGSTGNVMIATKLVDESTRKIERYYYNHNEGTLHKAVVEFVETNGKYLPQEKDLELIGPVTQVEVGRERSRDDDVIGKMRMLEGAIKSGDKIACDSDVGDKVWNGDVYRVQMDREWISADKKWERVRVSLDATYGYGKTGIIINQLDAEGKVIDSCEVKPVVDFFWSSRPRVAPLLQQGESLLYNSQMLERGLVTQGQNASLNLAGLRDLCDLIYLGLECKDQRRVLTIVHNGVRLVYKNETEWRQDIARLNSQAS